MLLKKVIATSGCLMCFWSFLCKRFNKQELHKKMYDAERHNYVEKYFTICASTKTTSNVHLRNHR